MDRGFYKEENINALLKERLKFLVALKTKLKYVRTELDRVYDDFRTFECYNEDYELYSTRIFSFVPVFRKYLCRFLFLNYWHKLKTGFCITV
jgi:hypothetical protein